MERRLLMAVAFMAVLTPLRLQVRLVDPGQIVSVGYLLGPRQPSALCTAVQRTWVVGKVGGHRRTVMDGALCAGQEPGEVQVRVGALKRQQGIRYQAVPSQCQVWRLRMSRVMRRMVAVLRDQADPTLRKAPVLLACRPENSWRL